MNRKIKSILSVIVTAIMCLCLVFLARWIYSVLLDLGWLWLLAFAFFPILLLPINALPAVFTPIYCLLGKNKIAAYIDSVIIAATGTYVFAVPFLLDEHFSFLQWIWTFGYWCATILVILKGISVTLSIPYEDDV